MKHTTRQRRRLANMDMSNQQPKKNPRWPPNYDGKQRVGFKVMNSPLKPARGQVTTAFTDPDRARGAAIWFLNVCCDKQNVEPPDEWELEMFLMPLTPEDLN